ncbi:hypothetical protein [Variovorax boronicumulans]|uniref:hypothetical protein n=1 Tax=Variovorax boronicumulans TaxID=436515 RepID=UPI001C5A2F95
MNIDHARVRREGLRWLILLALNNARPVGAYESVVLATAQGMYLDATQVEIRNELGYLEERELLKLKKEPSGRWFASLTRFGIDLVEYSIECEPGIGRPAKYW